MRAVLGLLLIGGGLFVLVELFNGNLHFPLGNVNQTSGSNSQQNNPNYVSPGNTPIQGPGGIKGVGGTFK